MVQHKLNTPLFYLSSLSMLAEGVTTLSPEELRELAESGREGVENLRSSIRDILQYLDARQMAHSGEGFCCCRPAVVGLRRGGLPADSRSFCLGRRGQRERPPSSRLGPSHGADALGGSREREEVPPGPDSCGGGPPRCFDPGAGLYRSAGRRGAPVCRNPCPALGNPSSRGRRTSPVTSRAWASGCPSWLPSCGRREGPAAPATDPTGRESWWSCPCRRSPKKKPDGA